MAKGLARGLKGTGAALACALLLAPAALAAPGDIYVVDEDTPNVPGSGAILKFGPSGGPATLFATNDEFSDPAGLALFPDGRLIMIDSGADALFSVDLASGAATNLGNGELDLARDVAVTADRKLLIAVEVGDEVVRYDPVTGGFSIFLQMPPDSQLRSIVTTRDGGAYVSAANQGLSDTIIYRISPQGIATPFVTGPEFGQAFDMTLSADERTLLVSTRFSGTVLAVDTTTKAIAVRATAGQPVAAAPLPDGSLIVGDRDVDGLRRVPSGMTEGPVISDAEDEFSTQGDIVIEPERCAGLIPTVVGTTGNDDLQGSVFADVFLTLGGNDVVRGLAGDDVVCAGDGRDRIGGGPGRDQLFGGVGNDLLRGKAGKDRLLGQAGKDRLIGGKGKDRLKGGKGKDVQKQ